MKDRRLETLIDLIRAVIRDENSGSDEYDALTLILNEKDFCEVWGIPRGVK